MRKTPTLVAGLLAMAAIGGTAVAQSVTPSHTFDVGVTPSNAGTTKKPAAVGLRLDISSDRAAGATASKIEINLPSGMKVNTRGFPICSEATITDRGADQCPRKSRLGTGTAGAIVNPTSPTPSNLSFRNTFFVGGRTFFNIFLTQSPGDVRAVLKANISNAGRRLTIVIPEDLQQPAPGVYSALTDIATTIKGTTGSGSRRHGIFELSKCTARAIRVSTKITYVPNPNPPAATTSTRADSAPCRR